MSMRISHPWLARHSSAGAPKEGGQQVREQLSPSWLRAQTTDGFQARTVREWAAAEVVVAEGVTAM